MPFSAFNGSRKSLASASSLILAFVSGLAASKLLNVVLGFRKRSGMIDCDDCGSSEVESTSREERLRCAVRAFAAVRSAGGVR